MTVIYQNYDQRALDHNYNARATVSDVEEYLADYTKRSAHARGILDCMEDISYGNHEDEVMDIFPAGINSPIFVFIHGGYWKALSQKDSASMALGLVARGITLVTLNYSLAPFVSLDLIVAQCRRALAWVYNNSNQFGGDNSRIFLGGSSAGGHLTGMLLAGGWQSRFDLPLNIVKGAIALSGLYDLEPIRLSNINEWMKLDHASVERNSPIRHLPDDGGRLVISFGENETNEFKRQSIEYAKAWSSKGMVCDFFEMKGRNHFDIIFDLDDFSTPIGRSVFGMILEEKI